MSNKFKIDGFEGRKVGRLEGRLFNKISLSKIPQLQQPDNSLPSYPLTHHPSKCAFTLSETLLSIVIIGVVASLTLPLLIQKQYEKETVAKVKKAYSILSQAYLRANTEFGSFDQWGITTDMDSKESHIIFGNNMKKFMKLTQDCVGQSNGYSNKNCYVNGSSLNINHNSRVVLNDGSVVTFRMYHSGCGTPYATSGKANTCGAITLYTNPKKETQNGKNAFTFFITKEGTVVPEGAPNGVHQFNKACNKNIARP